MKKNPPALKLYREMITAIKKSCMSAENKLELIYALADFCFDDKEPEGLSVDAKVAFDLFYDTIEKDKAAYAKQIESSRKGGLKSAEKRKSTQVESSALKSTQVESSALEKSKQNDGISLHNSSALECTQVTETETQKEREKEKEAAGANVVVEDTGRTIQPPDEYTVLRYAQQHGINVETARYYYRLMTGIEWKLGNEYMSDKWADHFSWWIAQRQTS